MKQGRSDLNNLLKEQQQFVELVSEFRKFNQEADSIDRHISSCRRMLPELSQRLNDEELDDMIKVLQSFYIVFLWFFPLDELVPIYNYTLSLFILAPGSNKYNDRKL